MAAFNPQLDGTENTVHICLVPGDLRPKLSLTRRSSVAWYGLLSFYTVLDSVPVQEDGSH